MSLAIQIVVTGVAAGGVYGLLAIGHTLIYRLTGIVHFALGDLVGLCVFATLLVAAGTGPVSQTNIPGGRFALAIVTGLLVCLAAGAGTYLLAIQPYLSRGTTIGWVGATVAIAFAIRAAESAVFDRPTHVFPDPLPFHDVGRNGVVTIGGASVQVRAFFVIALALALAFVATQLIERTRFGRSLKAITADADGARMVGIPVNRVVAVAFALAGGLAAVAALAAAPSAPFDVNTGTLLGVKGLVAALFVRFGSLWSAFAAGIGLGIVEAAIASGSIGGLSLGPQYSEVLPIAAALLYMAFRPPGAREQPE